MEWSGACAAWICLESAHVCCTLCSMCIRVERDDKQGTSGDSRGEPNLSKLPKLVQDLTDLAAGTGSRGIARSFQASMGALLSFFFPWLG